MNEERVYEFYRVAALAFEALTPYKDDDQFAAYTRMLIMAYVPKPPKYELQQNVMFMGMATKTQDRVYTATGWRYVINISNMEMLVDEKDLDYPGVS